MTDSSRFRCLTVGCNPKLYGETAADEHREGTGHRIAKWPVRSAEGKRRARLRNQSGYYDKYNVGAKSYSARFGRGGDEFTYSGGSFCGDETGEDYWGDSDG